MEKKDEATLLPIVQNEIEQLEQLFIQINGKHVIGILKDISYHHETANPSEFFIDPTMSAQT